MGVTALPTLKTVQWTDLYQIVHAYQTVSNLQNDEKLKVSFDGKGEIWCVKIEEKLSVLQKVCLPTDL